MRWFVFAWGVVGVLALLGQAVFRLAPLAWSALSGELSTLQWVGVVLWVAVMAHAEGYRGFHRRFSPRVVARALWLREHPEPRLVVLAPLFCMSLFHATPRGKLTARLLVAGILALITVVRMLPQPWRGLVDAGVVVGLAIGMTSLLGYALRAVLGTPPPIAPDLPEPPAT